MFCSGGDPGASPFGREYVKFVHAADIHLDSPLRNLAQHDGAPIERMRRASREAFESMIDLCIEQQVAFLVLAGDLYDHDCPNMQVAVFLRNQLIRLDKEKIRVVIVKGNHDSDNKITSALNLPPNTTILSDKKVDLVRYDDLSVPVAIHGQSFKPGPVKENLAASYPSALSGYLNIGVLHTSLGGYSEHVTYAPCVLTDLTTRGYAYWALGHIHKGEILARDPCWVVYPGNLQGRHAKETGPKGCVLVETEGDRVVSAETVALDVVRWHRIPIDLQNATHEPELVERIRAELGQAHKNADGRLSAIRLVLSGRTPLHDEIEKRPNRIRQTVLELAGEIAGDDIWIEKVRNETTAPTEPASDSTEAVTELIRILRETAGDAARLRPLLEEALGSLRAKLPEELKESSALQIIDDPGLARDALVRLEPQIVARLAGEEDK